MGWLRLLVMVLCRDEVSCEGEKKDEDEDEVTYAPWSVRRLAMVE